MTIIVCEQCNGTGWAKGKRCPCREEDDTAEARRKGMQVVKPQMAAGKTSQRPPK